MKFFRHLQGDSGALMYFPGAGVDGFLIAGEFRQQLLAPSGAEALNILHLQLQILIPLFLVESRSEAVSLVPHRLQDPQSRSTLGKLNALAAPREKHLLVLLCQGENRLAPQTEGFENSHGGAELALAAVDEYQVGQGLFLVNQAAVASRHGFPALIRSRRFCL
jgi:hypothetical protein